LSDLVIERKPLVGSLCCGGGWQPSSEACPPIAGYGGLALSVAS